LGETRRLRGKRTGLLLLLLLLLRQTSACAKRAAILGSAGSLGVAAEERVRIRIHGAGDVELGRVPVQVLLLEKGGRHKRGLKGPIPSRV
jgi:hypothetical protein